MLVSLFENVVKFERSRSHALRSLHTEMFESVVKFERSRSPGPMCEDSLRFESVVKLEIVSSMLSRI